MQALISMGQEVSTVSVVDDLLGRMTNKAKGICFATILAAFAFIVLVIWLYSAGSSTGYVEVSRAKRHMNVVDGNENETSASAYLTKEANLENNNDTLVDYNMPAYLTKDSNLACNEVKRKEIELIQTGKKKLDGKIQFFIFCKISTFKSLI